MNAMEEKELKRVFDHLQSYGRRSKLLKQLQPKMKRREKIEQHQLAPDEVKITDAHGNLMVQTQIEQEFNKLNNEIRALKAKVESLNNAKVKKISKNDLGLALKDMGKACTQSEIDRMVWEVDGNLDEHIDWNELCMMFNRNITDDTGLEPFQLFNIVQFLTYDKTFRGVVTMDDTMSMAIRERRRDLVHPPAYLLRFQVAWLVVVVVMALSLFLHEQF